MLHRDRRPASPEAIARMSAAMRDRGSDACGMTCEGGVGMAHRMMWTTPESVGETQPIIRDGSSLRLVADARIDNRSDLIATMHVGDAARVSDSELIVRAYERWGTRCVEHIVGDFAFALWDARLNRLFCARDPMGVKPFYYYASERLFAFASEAKALFALPDVPRDIDPLQVALFLDGTVSDRTRTHYKAVHRLPAAHTISVGLSQLREVRYWSPDLEREIRYSTSEQYADAFREIFSDAVRARLRSAYPVGAALSGGLDSSSIVCVARGIQRATDAPSLRTFSLVFPSLPAKDLRLIDERRYVESVVCDGGLLPTYLPGDEISPVVGIDEILERLGAPYAAPNLYLHWSMYRAACASGTRIFLDGFDGDSSVSHGFARLNGLVQRGEWDAFEREVRALAARRQLRPDAILAHFGLPYLSLLARRGAWSAWARTARQLHGRFALPLRRTVYDNGLRPAVPSQLRNALRVIRRLQPETTSLILPALARALRESGHAVEPDRDSDIMRSERASHAEGLSQPAYQLTLEMADQCAAGFGVEPRYPFFDRRLIDFCLAVPESEKLADGWPRLVFRRAMEGVLPREIRLRSDKGNLSPNFHRALRASEATMPELAANSPVAEYVDRVALQAMRKRYCAESTTLGRSDDGHTLFRVMVLQKWLERRVERAAQADEAPFTLTSKGGFDGGEEAIVGCA